MKPGTKTIRLMLSSALLAPMFSFIPSNSANENLVEFGGWTETRCFRGLEYRIKCEPKQKVGSDYNWYVEVRNNYDQPITLNIGLSDKSTGEGNYRKTIESGKSTISSRYLPAQPGESIYCYFEKARLGKDEWGTPYYQCDKDQGLGLGIPPRCCKLMAYPLPLTSYTALNLCEVGKNSNMGYSDFLAFCFSGDTKKFYESQRWTGWEKEVRNLSPDEGVVWLFVEGVGR